MLPTAELHDAHPDVVAVCELQFRSFGLRRAFSGPCQTVRVDEDHRPARDLLRTPGEGRVLMLDGGGHMRMGLLGDTMARLAIGSGWAGVVVNGVIRDSAVLDTLEIGIKALGTTARRNETERGGVVGVPVDIGGVRFEPGCWVYADDDAVIMSPRRLD